MSAAMAASAMLVSFMEWVLVMGMRQACAAPALASRRGQDAVGWTVPPIRGAGKIYCVLIWRFVGVASKISFRGQGCHDTPSVALFGSPFFAKAAIEAIIASDNSRRPG